ncbi:MAG TPA: hypothetical protein DEP48_00410 [Persephonella sp.]|uniref:Uncharacterized protein n=1 Tax=Persephonella marina (strain DSM 14350 / EX-H1) TaxID=123214 RepID=C0QQV4_PERMH|nr:MULTISPECIES: hypothetical protein [Persephonella]ACO04001.1 conserved hypothetical protein [Persephonella marina EX-H1]HCB68800.1 hypothetical protein [Persephonella sp.]
MRYVVQHKKSNYIRFLVIFFSLSVYLYLVSVLVLRYELDYLFPDQILLQIRGNPDEFLEPVSFHSLLEEIHIYLFINLMIFLTLSSINLRTSLPDYLKYTSGSVALFFILLESFSKILVYYGLDTFSLLSFLSFLLYNSVFFLINSLNTYSFLRGSIR